MFSCLITGVNILISCGGILLNFVYNSEMVNKGLIFSEEKNVNSYCFDEWIQVILTRIFCLLIVRVA